MSDLVERLRSVKEYDDMGLVVRGGKVAEEAANEIERLQKRLALAEAVCDLITATREEPDLDWWDDIVQLHEDWREARGADR